MLFQKWVLNCPVAHKGWEEGCVLNGHHCVHESEVVCLWTSTCTAPKIPCRSISSLHVPLLKPTLPLSSCTGIALPCARSSRVKNTLFYMDVNCVCLGWVVHNSTYNVLLRLPHWPCLPWRAQDDFLKAHSTHFSAQDNFLTKYALCPPRVHNMTDLDCPTHAKPQTAEPGSSVPLAAKCPLSWDIAVSILPAAVLSESWWLHYLLLQSRISKIGAGLGFQSLTG